MAIEIVDLPIKHGDFSIVFLYVLPEGKDPTHILLTTVIESAHQRSDESGTTSPLVPWLNMSSIDHSKPIANPQK